MTPLDPMATALDIWTIYERPADYPNSFVARRFMVSRHITPTDEIFVADTLDEVRGMLPPGLVCLARANDDAPNIVECWL